MRIIRALSVSSLLVLVAGAQAGCLIAAAAVGTGATVAYVRGDLETTLDASTAQVETATIAAANDMGLCVISHSADSLGGKIVARTSTDAGITIDLKGESEKLCKVSIRCGYFGDNTIQQRMLDKIKSELTAPVAASAVATTRPVANAEN